MLYIYLCLSISIHNGVDTHLPVGGLSNLGHDQLSIVGVCLGCVVHGRIIALWLLVAHSKSFDVEHSFRCRVATLSNKPEINPLGCNRFGSIVVQYVQSLIATFV